MSKDLNPDKALIFRITHRDNVPWILGNGLHCRNSNKSDPNFVNIGNPELIDKRHHRVVDIEPGGTLSDYIPFYFTPFSPMMYNIKTGWAGIRQRRNEEIAILVSSLHKLQDDGIPFIFTDRHAYLQAVETYSNLGDLDKIDWSILQRREFKGDPNDLGKKERYQAEALVYKHMPIGALKGIVCCNSIVVGDMQKLVGEHGLNLKVLAKSEWYF